MKTAKDYYTSHMSLFEEFDCIGGAEPILILPFLYGKKWDDIALGFVHTVNPTSIRVTEGDIKCDSCEGRVTVYVNNLNESVIEYIEQVYRSVFLEIQMKKLIIIIL